MLCLVVSHIKMSKDSLISEIHLVVSFLMSLRKKGKLTRAVYVEHRGAALRPWAQQQDGLCSFYNCSLLSFGNGLLWTGPSQLPCPACASN